MGKLVLQFPAIFSMASTNVLGTDVRLLSLQFFRLFLNPFFKDWCPICSLPLCLPLNALSSNSSKTVEVLQFHTRIHPKLLHEFVLVLGTGGVQFTGLLQSGFLTLISCEELLQWEPHWPLLQTALSETHHLALLQGCLFYTFVTYLSRWFSGQLPPLMS